MSLGFGVGDFIQVLKLAKRVSIACRNGPKQYREICSDAIVLENTLEKLVNDAEKPDSLLNSKGPTRKQDLSRVIRNCQDVLEQIQALINKHSKAAADGTGSPLARVWHSYRVGRAEMETLTGRLTFSVACVNAFYQSLQGGAIVAIERKLDRIYDKILEQDRCTKSMDGRPSSAASMAESVRSRLDTDTDEVFADLRKSLEAENIPAFCIIEYKDEIIDYLKMKLDSGSRNTMHQESTSDATLAITASLGSTTKRVFNPRQRLGPYQSCWFCVEPEVKPSRVPRNGAQRLTIADVAWGSFEGKAPCLMIAMELHVQLASDFGWHSNCSISLVSSSFALSASAKDLSGAYSQRVPQVEQLCPLIATVSPSRHRPDFAFKKMPNYSSISSPSWTIWCGETLESSAQPPPSTTSLTRIRFGTILGCTSISPTSVSVLAHLTSQQRVSPQKAIDKEFRTSLGCSSLSSQVIDEHKLHRLLRENEKEPLNFSSCAGSV